MRKFIELITIIILIAVMMSGCSKKDKELEAKIAELSARLEAAESAEKIAELTAELEEAREQGNRQRGGNRRNSSEEVPDPALFSEMPTATPPTETASGVTVSIETTPPASTAASAPDFVISGGTLIKYNGNETSVVIPNTVTSIGENAFRGNVHITSVTIPNSVTIIEDEAFFNTGLISVTIPNSVTSIGMMAFSNSKNLTSVTIPNSVTSIGYGAFSTTGITSITIPNSVTSIGGAFINSKLRSITIPNSITSIGRDTFLLCANLTSVNIPNSVTSIGYQAFASTGLVRVTIPASVTTIERGAFINCKSLTSVTFEGNPDPSLAFGFEDGLYTKLQEGGAGTYNYREEKLVRDEGGTTFTSTIREWTKQ